ncbi:MAG: S26 family signal peptidase [Candidatus Aenigmatarchaeota archaeon]
MRLIENFRLNIADIRQFLRSRWYAVLSLYTGYFVLAYLIVTAAPFIYRWLPVKVVIARDVSLPEKVYIWDSRSTKFKKGDYVEFNPPLSFYTMGKVLIKRIVCMPGEELIVKKHIAKNVTPEEQEYNYEYYCNGEFLGYSLKNDTMGFSLHSYTKSGKLHGYFVMGTHRRSYDSRYFGPVEDSRIVARVYPVF